MPQIWLTYEELAEFRDLPRGEGRALALSAGLDRRHCSDGETRVKLPADLVDDFLVHALVDRNLKAGREALAAVPAGRASPFDRLADEMADALAAVVAKR